MLGPSLEEGGFRLDPPEIRNNYFQIYTKPELGLPPVIGAFESLLLQISGERTQNLDPKWAYEHGLPNGTQFKTPSSETIENDLNWLVSAVNFIKDTGEQGGLYTSRGALIVPGEQGVQNLHRNVTSSKWPDELRSELKTFYSDEISTVGFLPGLQKYWQSLFDEFHDNALKEKQCAVEVGAQFFPAKYRIHRKKKMENNFEGTLILPHSKIQDLDGDLFLSPTSLERIDFDGVPLFITLVKTRLAQFTGRLFTIDYNSAVDAIVYDIGTDQTKKSLQQIRKINL